jgi:hypothetical protein
MGETIPMTEESKTYPMANGIVPENVQKDFVAALARFLVSATSRLEDGGGKSTLRITATFTPGERCGCVLDVKSSASFSERRQTYAGKVEDGQLILSL